MKRKESIAVFNPSRFFQTTLKILVIFALFRIGFSEEKSKAKEGASEVITSTMPPTTTPIPIRIPINKEKFSGKYESSVPNSDSIDFVFYRPDPEKCFDKDHSKYSVIFRYLVYAGKEIKEELALEEVVQCTYPNGIETVSMSIPRKGDANEITFTPKGLGNAKFQCLADIYDPFELSHSGVAVKDGCELKIELLNAYVFTTTTSSTMPSTTTKSATTTPGSTTSSATTSSNAPITTTQNTIIGLAPPVFGLIFGGIGLLLVLLVVGLLVYFFWWRKRKTEKEEKNEPPRSPGISPETMAKLRAMKPKVFPLIENQKQIKAGAMAEESDYPTEVSDDSGFEPVQKTESSTQSKSESTQASAHQSSKKDSKQ